MSVNASMRIKIYVGKNQPVKVLAYFVVLLLGSIAWVIPEISGFLQNTDDFRKKN